MYIVSSCLAGINCRYDGKSNENKFVIELVKQGKALPVCPEVLGGLPIPRTCCEIIADKNGNKSVIGKDGRDYTTEYELGAEKTFEIAKIVGAKKAILKSKSPSCGCGLIYDGTFSGRLIEGNGLTAELLIRNGIDVYTENNCNNL
ncbi:hypothetical protein EAL2_808p06690 (plasmid) [Peptoclostridium acidaminophilum DSM 3953]|uniref:Uncharacterized protein n=1 Tax=Peptoclostridium acidaminophilum DSM 3953 TaxID=1286171 RepID=W8TQ02_PEPAC|nr:DUF523 domain-containing protein [Peptoclostridium acidaminophilum]AHM58172.1 hypothetical protein EAL2_808p06690 [Peptoclostridium acidaminophilum DSM 3953]